MTAGDVEAYRRHYENIVPRHIEPPEGNLICAYCPHSDLVLTTEGQSNLIVIRREFGKFGWFERALRSRYAIESYSAIDLQVSHSGAAPPARP